MTRPSFEQAITALECARSSGDEQDIAALLRHVAETHGGGDDCDNPAEAFHARTWGRCGSCAETWPCRQWAEAHALAVLYLGRAVDRLSGQVAETLARPTRGIPPSNEATPAAHFGGRH